MTISVDVSSALLFEPGDFLVDQLSASATDAAGSRSCRRIDGARRPRRACWRPVRARRRPDRLATGVASASSGRMIASAAVRETSGERSKRAMRHKAGNAFAVGKSGQLVDACAGARFVARLP